MPDAGARPICASLIDRMRHRGRGCPAGERRMPAVTDAHSPFAHRGTAARLPRALNPPTVEGSGPPAARGP
jgi:hypothetical protein